MDIAPAPVRPTALLPSGLKVVELGEAVSTAVCGRFLVKLGAQVTRIVPSGTAPALDGLGPWIGEGEQSRSAVAEWLREGKTLLSLDLAGSEGREALEEQLRGADVVLVAGRSVDWEKHGVSISMVEAAAPSAIIGHLTPWGDDGPYADRPGGELQLQAMGGLMNLIGVMEREPVRLGGYPMQAAAGLLALDGVMIGLFQRQSTGRGTRFSTSEFESVAYVEWKISSFVQAGRRKELRGEEGGGPVIARCRDGFFALFFVPRNWSDVKRVIGDPRLDEERFATLAGRAEHQSELAAIVEENTITRSKKDLYREAQALGIPSGHVATMSDLLDSPQYRARHLFETVEINGIGTGEIPNAPWQVITADELERRSA